MKHIEKLSTEILPKTKIYFNSIENQFIYREKYNGRFETFNMIWGWIIFFLIITYIPILPYYIGEWDWLTKQTISFQIFNVKLGNFFIRWILFSALISIIFFLIFRPIDNYLDKKKEKYSLNYKNLPFVFLYKSIKSLDQFLINGHSENTRKSLVWIKQYYNLSFINSNKKIRTDTELNLASHLEELTKQCQWIEFSESTQNIISAFNKFNEKIYRRIEEKKDIDVCISILNKLLVYEYLQLDKVTKDNFVSIETNIDSVSKEILSSVSSLLNEISIVEENKEPENISKINKIENFIENFLGIFNHKSILVTFFCWLILLSIIVIGIIYFGIKTVGIILDSTVFIGGVSVVLIGTITLSAAIFNKKNDSNNNKH